MRNLLIILVLGAFVGCGPKSKGGEIFPSFDILLTDSLTHINTSTIKEGNPIVLLYFSPDCEHCQKETEAIVHNMSSLKDTRFYFVTNESFKDLKAFYHYYKLNLYSNIIMGRDERFFLLKHFKGVYPPYLVLYDRQKKQRASYQGETDVDTIISFVNHL